MILGAENYTCVLETTSLNLGTHVQRNALHTSAVLFGVCLMTVTIFYPHKFDL
jgi:hypothetical protein